MNYIERLYQEIQSRKTQLKILEKKGELLTCERISEEIDQLTREYNRYLEFENMKTSQIYSYSYKI